MSNEIRNQQILADFKSGYSYKALMKKYELGKSGIAKILRNLNAPKVGAERARAFMKMKTSFYKRRWRIPSENYLVDFDQD